MANIVTCDCKPLARIFSYGDSLPVDGVDLRTSIKDEEYYNNQEVTELDLPYCKSIGKRAFYNSSLTEIIVPACTKIDDYAFYRTYSAAKLKLKNADFTSVTEIGDYAFAKERKDWEPRFLSSLSFPSIETIGNNAFQNFDAQNDFTIDISNVTKIGERAFTYSEIDFHYLTLNNCIKIGQVAFTGTKADKIILPAIQELDYQCFRAVNPREKIFDFGPNLTKIESQLFYGSYYYLPSLTLYFRSINPPTLMGYFHSSLGQTIPKPNHIYVPTGSVTAYQTASIWSYYSDVISEIPET